MKRIRSGQSFLYRAKGYGSTVIEIEMKDRISGGPIQRALSACEKRFPYLLGKLVEKNGVYYSAPDCSSIVAVCTEKFRKLGSMATGYHLIDVTFFRNIIRVSFHHGLCDGKGILPFVESLLYYYCSFRYRKEFESDGIRVLGQVIDPEEDKEPFAHDYLPFDDSKVCNPDTAAFHLPEAVADPLISRRTEFIMDEDRFVSAAKGVGATPSLFAAILISGALQKLNMDAGKPVMCNLAMDMRKVLGIEKTHCNCISTAYLPFSAADLGSDMKTIAANYRKLLDRQREDNTVKANVNRQIYLYNKLDGLKSLDEKRRMMAFFDGMVNDTYVLSYLGRLKLNDYSQYVDSARFYNNAVSGLVVNMLCAGGRMTIDVLQGFDDMEYADAIHAAIEPYGLLGSRSGMILSTADDKSYMTASHQAERLYAKAEEN